MCPSIIPTRFLVLLQSSDRPSVSVGTMNPEDVTYGSDWPMDGHTERTPFSPFSNSNLFSPVTSPSIFDPHSGYGSPRYFPIGNGIPPS
jgi:hypothetical protein